MRNLTIRVLNKLSRLLAAAERRPPSRKETQNSIQGQRVAPWFKANGDNTLRLDYDLKPESLVLDLGGYEGQWSSNIYAMYNCNILIFEPYLPFARKIEDRFRRNPKIKVFGFGLGARNEKIGFSAQGDASSIFQSGPKTDAIDVASATEFLAKNNIQLVDLIKINIEGGEYELLETLLDAGLIEMFENIQVQFHDFIIENAAARMKRIHERLSLTHHMTYHYEFVWDNWRRKR